ncbi:MAG TPA: NAD-dependent epimerase/dehydratase family protein [Solirubrobacteraceae bacterium]|nr:NAD-dependent epimerase/dehydratase family protein [Solirubrobacteraceae bacterium]
MGKTLVTGATGFVGSHVARALVERGDDVRVAVRASSSREAIAGLDVDVSVAQLGDRAALRRALRGVDRVFHVAGTTNLRAPADELLRVNVAGTRVVMEEALRAGVERVVHTSSVGAVGPAPPHGVVDERTAFPLGLGVPYAESKHAAEAEALRVAARGLPVVIVCPAHVFGRGDLGPTSTGVVRRFLLRRIPAFVPGAINVVDVADVAAGHLLADERGVPGERYILGTRNYTWDRLFAELERLSGIQGPQLELPVGLALALAEVGAHGPLPSPVSPAEIRAAGCWWTCRSTKARRELGWTTRPHEDTVEETVRWWEERLGDRVRLAPRGQPLQWKLAGVAARVAEGIGGRLTR